VAGAVEREASVVRFDWKGRADRRRGFPARPRDPAGSGPEIAMLQLSGWAYGDDVPAGTMMPASYQKFTSQQDLGNI